LVVGENRDRCTKARQGVEVRLTVDAAGGHKMHRALEREMRSAGVRLVRFPMLSAAGASAAHVAYSSPAGNTSTVQVLYYLAIRDARREIIIQNPYMLPGNGNETDSVCW
jgi:phosphatidylserine/phosphatidylglycerophosphate/cardiolipin synthase-like enzyme